MVGVLAVVAGHVTIAAVVGIVVDRMKKERS